MSAATMDRAATIGAILEAARARCPGVVEVFSLRGSDGKLYGCGLPGKGARTMRIYRDRAYKGRTQCGTSYTVYSGRRCGAHGDGPTRHDIVGEFTGMEPGRFECFDGHLTGFRPIAAEALACIRARPECTVKPV